MSDNLLKLLRQYEEHGEIGPKLGELSRHPRDLAGDAADKIEELRNANEKLGFWMAAALDDPTVCKEMKDCINEWFEDSKEK